MNFAFTEEQLLIRDTAAAFLAEHASSQAVRSAMDTELGYDANLWQQLCQEMYWQAILIPEQYEGLQLGTVELAIVMEQMGCKLFCSPFLSTAVLATNSLLIVATDRQKKIFFTRISRWKHNCNSGALLCFS